MKDAARQAPTSRARAPYTAQACDICRRKKIRCNGVKPVCGPCVASNRHDECSWTGDPARHPRTEAHFEALRKRINALEAYCENLESMIDKCNKDHGGLSTYIPLRPSPEYQTLEIEEAGNSSQELVAAAENLKLEDRDLVMYGNVAPFRFAPVPAQSTSRFPEIIADPNAHYVLWLDGVSSSHVNSLFDWSRYLPANLLLTRHEHDKIIDLLFSFFTSWCLRVVPTLFLRDMYRAIASSGTVKTPHYSPMLHNALIALATAFSDDPHINSFKNREQYAIKAKSYLEYECEKPNICVVQALSLLGSFHASNGDQNLGYLYFGMSTRVGQILGLEVDCSRLVKAGKISHDDMLDRNWAHWTAFSLDVCWSLYVGRDCSVPIPAHVGDIPIPFVDSAFDQMTWHHPGAKIPPQPSFLSKTFAATCELCVVARRVMEVVNRLGTRQDVVNLELISKMDLQLNNWKSQLCAEVDITASNRDLSTPHRLMMHLLYWLMFILLHRPLFNRKARTVYSSEGEIDHKKLCKRAADNILQILQTWRKLYTLRYVPVTLFQAVFSAGTVFLLAGGHSLVKVELCIEYLNEIGKSWKSATNIGAILQQLLEDQEGGKEKGKEPRSSPPLSYPPPVGPPPGYLPPLDEPFDNLFDMDTMHLPVTGGELDSNYWQVDDPAVMNVLARFLADNDSGAHL
ncbi:fungal-specific transcription factor domain-containing protein [Armillaria novae-zelandiae]|uniref:Fungal-specific transcription factor domain-containing protein n=1 Tax=Armillaria novae-zelandiae TaxID=153914 RepID=A0AA39PJG2_9AGAR|nr:fungal-specific transcription factor domain-containing protein [Armillaria novae-zelandiae]